MNKPSQRHVREFVIAVGIYAVAIYLSTTLIEQTPRDSALRFALAFIPILPIILALISFLRYLRSIDELQQRIQLQAIGFAAGAAAMLTFGYGLLENVGFPRFSVTYILPTLIVLWGLSLFHFSRKYA